MFHRQPIILVLTGILAYGQFSKYAERLGYLFVEEVTAVKMHRQLIQMCTTHV
jgi:hypothetical protein